MTAIIMRDDYRIFRNGALRGVVGLDLDGTLGDYHGHFLKFAEGWLGRPMPDPATINPGLRLSSFMGVPHEEYRKIKLAYRQGGMKRTMPVYPGAYDLTSYLHAHDVEIWICTTRPYNKLDNVDPDTREWLDRNHILYDAILWDDEGGHGKYTELVQQVGLGRIIAVADDLTEQLKEAAAVGIKNLYLRAQPYNAVGVSKEGMVRVHNMESLLTMLKFNITDWQEAHRK